MLSILWLRTSTPGVNLPSLLVPHLPTCKRLIVNKPRAESALILPVYAVPALLNITLSSDHSKFTLPQQFKTIAPDPRLDFCHPAIGLLSGGTPVTCYFLDVPNSASLGRGNVTARFDTAIAITSSVMTADYSFTVGFVSPSTLFEGTTSISIFIGALSFSHVFRYVALAISRYSVRL